MITIQEQLKQIDAVMRLVTINSAVLERFSQTDFESDSNNYGDQDIECYWNSKTTRLVLGETSKDLTEYLTVLSNEIDNLKKLLNEDAIAKLNNLL